jgi:hypothetical protein
MSIHPEGVEGRLSDTTQNQDEASVIARSRRERGIADETGSVAASLEFFYLSLFRGRLQVEMTALCRTIFPGGLAQRDH